MHCQVAETGRKDLSTVNVHSHIWMARFIHTDCAKKNFAKFAL